jgi:hypothetical protein
VPSPVSLLLDKQPLKCEDNLVSEEIASAPQIYEGHSFSANPVPNLPLHPQGLIGDDPGAVPTRILFWDLALNFHRRTRTILTIEPTFQHDGSDLDSPHTIRIDTGGNSQCEVKGPLFEPPASVGFGQYTLNMHTSGLGIESIDTKYNFSIVP